MKLAFLMDPLESVKAYKDTTYYLMLACAERGHEVFYFNQNSIRAANGVVTAPTLSVAVHASVDEPFTAGETKERDLSELDAIVIRTDPPLDRSYLYAMLLLDLVGGSTVVVNSPSGIRSWNEKLAALFYPDLTPATLVTRDAQEILRYGERFGRVTLKPVDGHGGEGIVFIERGAAGAAGEIDRITRGGRHWVIAQEYLPAASDGDKRIHLLNGEPIGAILRVHAEGMELNNLDQGGEARPAELDARDLEICEAIGAGLIEQGIFYCGIDVIGGMLIEINVTSPTGLQELCRFSGRQHHHDIIAALERKVSDARGSESSRAASQARSRA